MSTNLWKVSSYLSTGNNLDHKLNYVLLLQYYTLVFASFTFVSAPITLNQNMIQPGYILTLFLWIEPKVRENFPHSHQLVCPAGNWNDAVCFINMYGMYPNDFLNWPYATFNILIGWWINLLKNQKPKIGQIETAG